MSLETSAKVLAIHFVQNSSGIEIYERAAHGLIVHVRLVLVLAPQTTHGLGVPVGQLDEVRVRVLVLEQLKEELLQVLGVAFSLPFSWCCVLEICIRAFGFTTFLGLWVVVAVQGCQLSVHRGVAG